MKLLFIILFTSVFIKGGKEGTVSFYTYGLEAFDKREIEILNTHQEPKEVYDFLVDISLYVINYDAHLLDGETIGFTEDQKLPMTISQAVALALKHKQ